MNYYNNKSLKDSTYNGKAFGSNAVALPGSAYVDLDIVHQLGSELSTGATPAVGANVVITPITNGFNIVCDGLGSDHPGSSTVRFPIDSSIPSETNILNNMQASINSGDMVLTRYYNGSSYITIDKTIVNGDNNVLAQVWGNASVVQYNINPSIAFDVDLTFISIKEITTNNSYFTYTDPVTQDIVDVTLPTATTYRMENDFSNAVSHDAPFSQADKDLMKADPLTLMRVWFDGLVLPSGFAKVNIKNLYCGNEGVVGGAYVQDLSVDLGASNPNYDFSNGLTDWLFDAVHTTVTDEICTVIGEGSNNTSGNMQLKLTEALLYDKIYIFTARSRQVGTLSVHAFISPLYSSTYFNIASSTNEWEVKTFIGRPFPDSAVRAIGAGTDLNLTLEIDYFQVREATASEIQNYTDACRTTYLNTDKGMSNLLLEQDVSGRPTATLPDNTVDYVNSNGASIDTGFRPNLSKYTIKEVVSGELQEFGGEEVTNGTFDADIAGWTNDSSGIITHDDSYGGCAKIEAEGHYAVLRNNTVGNYLIAGKTYIFNLDIFVEGTDTDYRGHNGSGIIENAATITANNEWINIEYTITMLGDRYFYGGMFDMSAGESVYFDNVSVKELTTKTRRTEHRVLKVWDDGL